MFFTKYCKMRMSCTSQQSIPYIRVYKSIFFIYTLNGNRLGCSITYISLSSTCTALKVLLLVKQNMQYPLLQVMQGAERSGEDILEVLRFHIRRTEIHSLLSHVHSLSIRCIPRLALLFRHFVPECLQFPPSSCCLWIGRRRVPGLSIGA